MQLRMWLKGLVLALRQWIVWIVAASVIGASAFFVVPGMVPDRLVRAQINEQIGRWTGGAFRLRADAAITIEPGFRVVVSDPALVSVSNDDAGPVMTADSLVAPIKISALLFGRVEIAQLVLLRPDIDLRVPVEHFALAAKGIVYDDPPVEQTHALGDVMLIDGTVRFSGMTGDKEVSDLDLRLGTDAASDGVAMQGSLLLGGRYLNIDLELDDLRALISRAGTHATLNVSVGLRQDSETDDDAESDHWMPYEVTETLRHAAGSIGLSRVGFGIMAVEGTFSITPQVVAVTDATFSLGGVEMEGDVRAGTSDRPVIAQLIGLPGAINDLAARAEHLTDGDWVDVPVTMALLDGLDLEIALAGTDVPFGDLTFDTAAVSVAVGDGTTAFDLAANRDGLGQMQAGVVVEHHAGERVRLMTAGRADAVSVGKFTQFLTAMGPPPLIGTEQTPEGTMNGAFNVRSRGTTLGQMVANLNGVITAQMKDGSLAGTDLVATLETLFKGREFMTEEYGPLIPTAGRTQFHQADARIDFASGLARVSRVHIAGERFGIDMLGEVQLTQGTMNVGGNAVLLSSPQTGGRGVATLVDLPFGVGGTVFSPVVAAGVPTVTAAQLDANTND